MVKVKFYFLDGVMHPMDYMFEDEFKETLEEIRRASKEVLTVTENVIVEVPVVPEIGMKVDLFKIKEFKISPASMITLRNSECFYVASRTITSECLEVYLVTEEEAQNRHYLRNFLTT